MQPIEIYVKLKFAPAALGRLRDCARAIVAAAKREPGCIRCDWFLQAQRHEAIAMLVYRDAAALRAHRLAATPEEGQLRSIGSVAVEFLGQPPAQAQLELQSYSPTVMHFASGLDAQSGAAHFARPEAAPGATAAATPHIEIYTRFSLRREGLAAFKQGADQLLELVRKGDPATSRYDWFFDDARLACVAMDTYADAPGMFAHMKNCHDAHAKLLEHSVMVTEFLGTLAPEAMQAVAKYDPYIAPFLVGLGPHSAGGI